MMLIIPFWTKKYIFKVTFIKYFLLLIERENYYHTFIGKKQLSFLYKYTNIKIIKNNK